MKKTELLSQALAIQRSEICAKYAKEHRMRKDQVQVTIVTEKEEGLFLWVRISIHDLLTDKTSHLSRKLEMRQVGLVHTSVLKDPKHSSH